MLGGEMDKEERCRHMGQKRGFQDAVLLVVNRFAFGFLKGLE